MANVPRNRGRRPRSRPAKSPGRRHDQPTPRQTIDRAQRLGNRHRSTHHCERDRRRQRHLRRVLHHRRERDRSVEPGHRKDHVVVHRQGDEAELRSSLRVRDEMIERVRMTPEVHQREMGPELHLVPHNPRSITPGQQPTSGNKLAVPTNARVARLARGLDEWSTSATRAGDGPPTPQRPPTRSDERTMSDDVM